MKSVRYLPMCLALFTHMTYASSESEMQKAINQVGEPCQKVTQVFHIGKDKESSLHFSVACSGGQNYYVLVKRSGDANVMQCAVMDKMAGGRGKPGSCFTKIN